MFGLKLVTAPVQEPVSLSEAKARLRVTVDDSDDDIAALIREARAQCESECGRAFCTQTFSLYLDAWPCDGVITIPRPPLQSVTYVKYYDSTGTQQTLASDQYHVATGGEPGRVVRPYNVVWPTVQYGRPEAIEVKFVAGVANPASLPPAVKAAILVTLSDRADDPSGGTEIPPAARRLLNTLETGQVW